MPAQARDAEVGLDEYVERVDLELAAELVQRSGDEAAVDGADDVGVCLRELVERAAAHADLVIADLGREALLVEQLRDVAHRLCVGDAHERKRALHEVPAPGAARPLGLRRPVATLRDSAGEDGREKAVLVVVRGRRLGSHAVAFHATHRLPATAAYHEKRAPDGDSGAGLKVLALFLGIAVGVLIPIAIWLAASAQSARSAAEAAAVKVAAAGDSTPATAATHDQASHASAGAYATPSFAGVAPANADALAAAHKAFPAELPAAPAGPVAHVTLGIEHRTVSIAPGVRYEAWTFGKTAPGPVIHVRQGQTVKVTLRNDSPMPHSVDFHAAKIAPNVAFSDVMPGESKTFSFVASTPGVFMYHCGTAPAFVHIANGMYGAIVVEPRTMPPAQRQYVLVSSEWYLNAPGGKAPAALDLTKANNMTPDWVTWNGYAHQYKEHPLTAKPGETVRFWVVAAGPSLGTAFHVVGSMLDRAWVNQDLVDPPQHGVQTALVPAGGGGVFDVEIDKPGIYPFVSHSFASVNLGQVGLLKVGEVAGTMSH